jgi:hypothetical protein
MEARSANRSACALVRGPCREPNESMYPLVAMNRGADNRGCLHAVAVGWRCNGHRLGRPHGQGAFGFCLGGGSSGAFCSGAFPSGVIAGPRPGCTSGRPDLRTAPLRLVGKRGHGCRSRIRHPGCVGRLPAGRWAGPLLGVLLPLIFGASVEPFRILFVPAGFVLGVGALVVPVRAKLVPAVRARRPGTARRAAAVDWAARGLLSVRTRWLRS